MQFNPIMPELGGTIPKFHDFVTLPLCFRNIFKIFGNSNSKNIFERNKKMHPIMPELSFGGNI